MTKDLGTYHLRVEFEDGSGYIQQFSTGMRYTDGRDNNHPLTAQPISPAWESEDDLFRTMEYMYLEGNYSCDCNKKLFLADAIQAEGEPNEDCGDEIKLKRLTAIRPDGTERVLWPNAEVRNRGGEN